MERRIGAFDLDYVLTRLRNFGDAAGAARRRSSFIVAGDALLPAETVAGKPRLAERIRGFHGGLLQVELPFAASVILVKSNVRAQGVVFGHGVGSGKVRLRRSRVGRSFERDVRMRRLSALHFGDQLRAPRILARDTVRMEWLLEEQVTGNEVSARRLADAVLPTIKPLYSGTARVAPILRSARSRAIAGTIVNECARLGHALPINATTMWVVSFVHGDLSSSNTLTSETGTLWLLDWECAGTGPVCIEIGRLCARHRASIGPAVSLLASLDPDARTLRPDLQLACGIAYELAENRRLRAHYIKDLMRIRKVTATEAARQIDEPIREIEANLRTLLAGLGRPGPSRLPVTYQS